MHCTRIAGKAQFEAEIKAAEQRIGQLDKAKPEGVALETCFKTLAGKKGHVTVAELKHYLTGPFFGGAITPAQFDELIAHSGLSGNLSLQDFDTLFSTAPAIM